MFNKSKKQIIYVLLACALLTGCNNGGNKKAVATPTPSATSNSKLSFNLINGDITFSNVSAFDFMSNKLCNFSGKGTYASSTTKSVAFFKGGNYYELGVNKDIIKRPSSIKIYRNKKRTSSTTYNIKYL